MRHQFTLNTIATTLNLIISFSISFFLTSYIVRTIGATAYGFFGLANNVVNYALIITTALNSMAARFIGIEVHKGNHNQASVYFSSVFVADLIFSLIIFIPCIIAIWYINFIFDVPKELISDVKVLFYIVFLNMCLNIVAAVFGGVYIIKNRLDISAVIRIISNISKAILLLVLYFCFRPSIVYLGTATLLATLITIGSNIHFNKKFLPKVVLSKELSSWSATKKIISSGVWNSLNQLSVTLLHGMDLLIANIFVSSAAMGVLSVAGTMPSAISACIFALANLFTPKFLEFFAKEDFKSLYHELKNSIKFMTLITCIPIGFLIGFGIPFYKLWVPTVDIKMLYILALLVIIPLFSGGAICGTNYIFTVTNKLKWQSIVLLISSAMNILIVFTLLNVTSWGVYAIVGVSATIGLLRNFIFNAPYAAHCIHQPLFSLLPDMIKSLLCLLVWGGIGYLITIFFDLNTWIRLIITGGVYVLFMSVFTSYLLISKSQRLYIFQKAKALLIYR